MLTLVLVHHCNHGQAGYIDNTVNSRHCTSWSFLYWLFLNFQFPAVSISYVLLQVVTIYSIASTRFITCIALQRYNILTPGQSRHADSIDIDSLQCVSDSVDLSLVHTQHQHQRPTYTSIHGFRSCTTLVC